MRLIIRRRRPAMRRRKSSVIIDPVRGALSEEQLRSEALAYLPGRLQELATQYGFSYQRVRIKHNLSNWGSCSSKGNINLNLCLMTLPKDLQDYVMLHELCHLRELNHGPRFHALLESVCPNHKELASKMRQYHPQ